MNEIIIIFKTHLDAGFTDSAENIINYYCDTYIPRAIENAYELFSESEHIHAFPLCRGIFRKNNRLLIKLAFPQHLIHDYGCPQMMEYTVRFLDRAVEFDVAWYGKQACRCAEAIWFTMEPYCQLKSVQKLGKEVDVNDICSYGNRRMHAVDEMIHYDKVDIYLHDSCLVSVGGSALLNFENFLPKELEHPDQIALNLYNNIWGTNFPMWYDEDARFRFTLKVKEN